MVQQSLGDSGRYLNDEWHETRREAREESFSIDEWGEPDKTDYDLDTVNFDTKEKDSSFIMDTRQESEGSAKGGFDIRELPTVRD